MGQLQSSAAPRDAMPTPLFESRVKSQSPATASAGRVVVSVAWPVDACARLLLTKLLTDADAGGAVQAVHVYSHDSSRMRGG